MTGYMGLGTEGMRETKRNETNYGEGFLLVVRSCRSGGFGLFRVCQDCVEDKKCIFVDGKNSETSIVFEKILNKKQPTNSSHLTSFNSPSRYSSKS